MALTVGELVAYIRADGTQFDRQIDQSGQKFSGLQRTIGTGVKTIATAFTAATGVAAGLGIAAFKIGKDFNVLQQNSRAALKTILGSAEAAADQMDRLDEFASNSPFARQVWITAQQQLLGFGVEAERVVPILDAVQQSVAAVGGNNEQIEAITYALAQMQGQGKLTGETLNQLGQYGIDAASIIGAEMGKSGQEIRKLASKPGGIPVDQVWDPLVDGLLERFGGATEGLRQQWDGAVDRVKAAWRDIGSILAAPFIDPMGGGRAVDWANDFADTLRAGQTKIKPFVDIIVDRLAPGMDRVTPLFKNAQDVINSWDISKVNTQLDQLGQYTPIIAGVSGALLALGGNSIGLSRLGMSLNPVVAGLVGVAATSPEVQAMLSGFLSSLQPLLPLVGEFGVQIADTAMYVLHRLVPALGDLLIAGGDVAVTLGGALLPALGDLLVAGTPLIDILANVVTWMSELPGPVITSVAAFVALRGPIADVVESARNSGALRTLADNIAASRSIARETGGEISTLRAGMEVAKDSAVGLGTAMRGAFISTGIGLAITGVVTALTYFITSQAEAKRHVDDLSESLDRQTGAMTDNTRELVYNRLEQDGVVEAAVRAGIALDDLVDAAMDPASDAAGRLREQVAEANAEISRVHEDEPQNTSALQALRDKYEDLWFVSREVSAEQDNMASAEERARNERAAGVGVTEDATDATLDHLAAQQALREELEEGIDATLSAAEAALRVEDAQARATEAVERKREADAELQAVMENGNATEEEREAAVRASEQATRDADRAIIDYTRQVDNHISALGRNNASYGEMRDEMRRARDSFIEQRVQMGMTRDEAEALADQYGLVPNRIDTMVHLEGVQAALNEIGNLDRTLNNLNGKSVSASVNLVRTGNAMIASGGYAGDFAFAGGGSARRRIHGLVRGPGTPTSDSIDAKLSTDEFVQRAAAVRYYGVDLMYALNHMRIPRENLLRGFNLGGAADGQAHRPFTVPSSTQTTAPAPAAPAVAASVSLDGGHLTGTFRIREDGLVDLIDGRLELAAAGTRRMARQTSGRA